MPRLGLVLLLVPFLEFYVLVEVGARIGAFNAVLLVILFAMVGVWLARTQGMGTLARIQQNLAQGVLPADEMLDGLFLLLAGLLMVFPGFVSDVFGILLLLPPVRRLAAHLLRRHMNATIQAEGRAGGSSVHVRTWYFGPGGARHTETFGGGGPMFGPNADGPNGPNGPNGPDVLDGLAGPDGSGGSGPHPYGPDHGGGAGSGHNARQEPRRTVVIDCEPVEPSGPAEPSGPVGPSGPANGLGKPGKAGGPSGDISDGASGDFSDGASGGSGAR
ncbi:FxsA family protein [Nitratidesulfovibrio sp. SRB-5]|uniref:FxsA family protein n=1 Tax=Nitratidesulfovibrio sp. SRB-5 TaxID=2872636 RepID=UPI001025CC1D|nr:FxsA family protein [Nitratidesulfovibrio sp. SRB-5]MBZ2171281.1 FxsA family protein [Nitratidesulfovibrio sp. SRB-5]RXF77341.1 FxsA family protein [Desulfovibrio sp. DS-1]